MPADPQDQKPSTGSAPLEATLVSPADATIISGDPKPISAASTSGTAVPRVGRYEVIGKLGEGAMAEVYRANDPDIQRQIVLKFLRGELCVETEYRSRFLREARAAGMLAHPNIVTVFDVGEINGRPYIAMELLNGGALDSILERGKGLPVMQVLQIGIQLANALDYAHSKGIYHRDVKPSNILQVGDGRTVKIADFGIAHMASMAEAEKTRAGTIIGTPHYMAPEQALGSKVDGRADLFSAGVVLYELLTGHRPFEADNMVTLVMRIAKEEPKPMTHWRKDLPASLRRIVECCLQKAPENRYATGRELADALAKVWRELDAETTRKGVPKGIPLKVKLALGMAALVAVTMAATSALVTYRQHETMLKQAVEQGASLTRLIAAENAAPTLSEDWVGIDVFVQEVARALDVESISLSDRAGVVRVSSDAAAVGKPAVRASGERVRASPAGVTVQRVETAGRPTVFTFEAPVTFQGKTLGAVQLALPEEPLASATRQSILLLALLLVVTAATVALATYLLVERYGKPLRLLRDSLEEVSQGRFGYRIREQRNDEFGEVFRSFDAMAERLERGIISPPTNPGGAPKTGKGAA
jgi:tRNA A-37 threonylcarbamoyl transferase component Bud32/HAMP domain-containing protein